ncbi:EamA-like transporter family protein [Paracoccus thiocyanatus]|uniref:EamA-like transporter family protein n=1 Tax=Paracoccus thiocyanatus TaxID=34006 RepID=A0A1N6PQP2_9RHOB|nr:EamA family transporter [Paracoccus thiocyanatus]SIQ06710.1 EamA-like transporter family protein [Paracoccus thiocyanatus]
MSWILATLIAAAAQTGRNAAQRRLTAELGTIGATAVRFLFGLPFAALVLAGMAWLAPVPRPDATVLAWTALGAGAQIAATALMLLTMENRGFGVTTALIKTEPVTLALIGALLLAEPLGPARMGAIATATLGVTLMSGADWRRGGWRAAGLGIAAGALFGLSAIGFRGAILALPFGDGAVRAATVLVLALALQSAIMLAWLGARDRPALAGIARHWRGSLGAGALGALASLFWFLGFALTAAANVRTLALVEVVLAQIVSGRLFREGVSRRQLAGMALVVLGVAALVATSG